LYQKKKPSGPLHCRKSGFGRCLFRFLLALPFSARDFGSAYENADGKTLVVVGTDF
jgi:hypothetical protein